MNTQVNLKAIKKELLKLTDTEYLKTELHKITQDIRGFDLHVKLSPQAKTRLKVVEQRFHEMRLRVAEAQKQVDSEVNKFLQILKKTMHDTEARFGFASTSKATAKAKKTAKKKASANGADKKSAQNMGQNMGQKTAAKTSVKKASRKKTQA